MLSSHSVWIHMGYITGKLRQYSPWEVEEPSNNEIEINLHRMCEVTSGSCGKRCAGNNNYVGNFTNSTSTTERFTLMRCALLRGTLYNRNHCICIPRIQAIPSRIYNPVGQLWSSRRSIVSMKTSNHFNLLVIYDNN